MSTGVCEMRVAMSTGVCKMRVASQQVYVR